MANPEFKRGDRVRYIANHCPSFSGNIGTVTGRDARGWLRVRFDRQQPYEKGERVSDSSLELYGGNETPAHRRVLDFHFTRAEQAAIADAVSNSDLPDDVRIPLLDKLQ